MSDVSGSLIKQYTLGQTTADADWLIGAAGLPRASPARRWRSMKEPGTAYDDDVLGKDPQPATMDGDAKQLAGTTAASTSTPASPTTPLTWSPSPSADTPGTRRQIWY